MIITATIILFIILMSKFFEGISKVPYALSLIVISYFMIHHYQEYFLGINENFKEILFLLLPIIILPDVLGISRKELKNSSWAIFYLAFIAVLIGISAATSITYMVDSQYHLSIGALVALFSMLMATDVVSVGSIFGQFKLPEKLKIYAEGESLFNDITAMVIFYFIALPMISGDGNIVELINDFTLFKVFFFSIAIGVVAAFIGFRAFNFFNDTFEKFIVIYLMSLSSFALSEHFHFSGILAVVFSVIIFKYLFDTLEQIERIDYNKFLSLISRSKNKINHSDFRAYKKEAYYIGIFANAIIFISISSIVKLDHMWIYYREILFIFILTTVIRYLSIVPLIVYNRLPMRWTNALTFAGMKGGLTLIMLFSLPNDFENKELFESVVVGVVLLSMFVYTVVLMTYIYFKKSEFESDRGSDGSSYEIFKNVKENINKEAESNAYNELFFEELVEKEILRAERYGYKFVIVLFKYEDKKELSEYMKKILRTTDNFGKFNSDTYAILAIQTDVQKALILADRVKELLHVHVGLSSYSMGDTLGIMYEKCESAIKSKKDIDLEL